MIRIKEKNYIDRIYDTYIDEDELQMCDKIICEIADKLDPKVTLLESLF